MPRETQKMAFAVLNFSEGFGMDEEKQEKKKQIKDQKQYFLATFGSFLLTFLNFSELRSSCPESDFLLGLLFPDEDIIGCRRFQSLDEFTTSLASCKKTWKVIETLSGLP